MNNNKFNHTVWVDAFAPRRAEDLLTNSRLTKTLLKIGTDSEDSLNFLFLGPRGVGKLTRARIIIYKGDLSSVTFKKDSIVLFNQNNSSIDIISGPNHIELFGSCFTLSNKTALVELLKRFSAPTAAAFTNPNTANKKTFIIHDVDLIPLEVQAALRRTLEECSEYAKFIFLACNEQKLAKEFMSRCVLIRFPAPLDADIELFLRNIMSHTNYYVSPDVLQGIIRMSNGNLVTAGVTLQKHYLTKTLSCLSWVQITQQIVNKVFDMPNVSTLVQLRREINELIIKIPYVDDLYEYFVLLLINKLHISKPHYVKQLIKAAAHLSSQNSSYFAGSPIVATDFLATASCALILFLKP